MTLHTSRWLDPEHGTPPCDCGANQALLEVSQRLQPKQTQLVMAVNKRTIVILQHCELHLSSEGRQCRGKLRPWKARWPPTQASQGGGPSLEATEAFLSLLPQQEKSASGQVLPVNLTFIKFCATQLHSHKLQNLTPEHALHTTTSMQCKAKPSPFF